MKLFFAVFYERFYYELSGCTSAIKRAIDTLTEATDEKNILYNIKKKRFHGG